MRRSERPGEPLRVALFAYPDVQALDLSGPLEMFARATRLLRDEGRTHPGYSLAVIGTRAGPITASSGFRFLPDTTFGALRGSIDTLLVLGGRGVEALLDDQAVLGWLRRSAGRVRRLGSVCTGAFLLAEAGLLDGRAVTTHWSRAADLAQRYPRLRVGASAGAPGRQERPSSDPRIPQGAGSRSGGGDRATAAGGGAPRPAAVRRGPRGGGVALRLRQRRGPAPRLPPLPARDAVRLPRALLGAAGARLVSFANRRIHPAFVIASAIFVVLLCAAAVRATPSILLVPLDREFGWSRAVLSSAVSVNLVLYGLVGPFAAALMERFGRRRTILVSLAVL